jgi:predicted phosphodiesterase
MKGFLFIGDPHVTSLRPGRRIDDYLNSVIGKLAEASELARQRELVPIILGDLFHRAGENHLSTLCRLTAVLQSFPQRPLVIGGNHDKNETLLRDADALYLLALAGTVEVIDGVCREAHRYDFEGRIVSLWVAPYGAVIPTQIDAPGADSVVLVTHHNLAFEGAYPQAAPLHEIIGCSMVVNGHMHKTAPSITKGQTVWHNPGNIEPLSVDCIEHVPAVWAWLAQPNNQLLGAHPVTHVRDCFDMTGLTVDKASTSESVEAAIATQASDFAELLAATNRYETALADADDVFLEELAATLVEMNASDYVQRLLAALATKAPVPVLEEPAALPPPSDAVA